MFPAILFPLRCIHAARFTIDGIATTGQFFTLCIIAWPSPWTTGVTEPHVVHEACVYRELFSASNTSSCFHSLKLVTCSGSTGRLSVCSLVSTHPKVSKWRFVDTFSATNSTLTPKGIMESGERTRTRTEGCSGYMPELQIKCPLGHISDAVALKRLAEGWPCSISCTTGHTLLKKPGGPTG